MKKIISITLLIMLVLSINNLSYAGMADWTDEDASLATNEQLKEQEKILKEGEGKSGNNYLTQLSVEGQKLVPNFDKDTFYYNIEQEVDVNSIKIEALAEDSKATISGAGEAELQTGKNEIKVTVKAENGLMKSYFISVNKKKSSIGLTSLKLKAIEKNRDEYEINFTPSFSNDNYSYECKVYNDVQKINVEAIPENNNCEIEIKGNEKLTDSENSILISVVDRESNETTKYKVKVVKDTNGIEKIGANSANNNNSNGIYYLMGICIGCIIIALALGIYFKKYRKRTKH